LFQHRIIILRILLNLPSSPLLRPSLVLTAMENSNSSRGYGQWGFERKLDTSPFLCGLIMEKLVYDIIPRNQRSNPKGFRLPVKLKFNKATTTNNLLSPDLVLTIALASCRASTICFPFLLLVSSRRGSPNPPTPTTLWTNLTPRPRPRPRLLASHHKYNQWKVKAEILTCQ
jgi:hypothetical protein